LNYFSEDRQDEDGGVPQQESLAENRDDEELHNHHVDAVD
jgi:hypothetical protein